MTTGVLALQGASSLHLQTLARLGEPARAVKQPEHLAGCDRLVLPGGESTTMSFLLTSNDLFDPIAAALHEGMPVFGTCAGMILLAQRILDGRPDQRSFGAIDIDVRRNAFGRQVDSFESDLDIVGFDHRFHAVFIRAPVVVATGPAVEVLATVDDEPVLCRQGDVLVAAFHPELADDDRLHQWFCSW